MPTPLSLVLTLTHWNTSVPSLRSLCCVSVLFQRCWASDPCVVSLCCLSTPQPQVLVLCLCVVSALLSLRSLCCVSVLFQRCWASDPCVVSLCCFSAPEPQVLDFVTQQLKLLPLVAEAWAVTFIGHYLRELYFESMYEINQGNVGILAQVSGPTGSPHWGRPTGIRYGRLSLHQYRANFVTDTCKWNCLFLSLEQLPCL